MVLLTTKRQHLHCDWFQKPPDRFSFSRKLRFSQGLAGDFVIYQIHPDDVLEMLRFSVPRLLLPGKLDCPGDAPFLYSTWAFLDQMCDPFESLVPVMGFLVDELQVVLHAVHVGGTILEP